MKKLWVGVSAAVLAGLMCVSLVACGGGTNAKNIAGEEFPEEQKAELWAAAFEEDNFDNFKMVVSGDGIDEDGKKQHVDMTVIVTEQGSYTKMPASYMEDGAKGSVELYIEKTEDGGYFYMKDEGKWYKTKMDADTLAQTDYGKLLASMFLVSFADGADRYEYSAEWKGYIVPDEPASLEAPVLKFQNGKLVGIYSEEDGLTQSLVFTYGGQSIKFPNATELGA